uniref:Uncharacterized protein n=1 Tax=Rhodnius prolixus TaxID=13249 RepID=T1IAV8_RHOPR
MNPAKTQESPKAIGKYISAMALAAEMPRYSAGTHAAMAVNVIIGISAFKYHRQMNKYLLNIPPWLKKGAISAPNTACSGIKKSDLETICKAHNDCKDKQFYKNKTNKKCLNHLSHRRRETIKDTLLIFEYPNLSLKNLKNNACIENVALGENCFIQNTASHICKRYDSLLDAIAVLLNSETNYNLHHKEDDYLEELLLDVGLLNCYLDNHNEQNLQPTPNISRPNEEHHTSRIKVKNNMNSKKTDCLLVNFISLNGQEFNIKIDLGNLWRELYDEKNQNLESAANRTLSLNCYLSMLANKAKTGLDKYKTVLNLSKQPKERHDLELNTVGLHENERKMHCPADLKIASKDSGKVKDNAKLNTHNSFTRASNSCGTISENFILDNDIMNNKCSNKEIRNNNSKGNKISEISEAQKVENTYCELEYVNDKQHKEITSNTPRCDLRNRIKLVKVKISDFFSTYSEAELSAPGLTSSNIQKRKPQKVNIEETFVFPNLHSNSKLQSQSNDLGVELNENKCAGLILKKENLNRFYETNITSKCVKVSNKTECVATNDKCIDRKGSASVKIEDGKMLSKSNRNSNFAQNIEEIVVRSPYKGDQVDRSLSTALSKITHEGLHSVSNFDSKVAKEDEKGITKTKISEEWDYQSKNKNIDTLKTAGEKNILSVSSTHLTTSQKIEEEMMRKESSKKRNQGDENKCVAFLKVDGKNRLPVPNHYSLPKLKIERARNDKRAIMVAKIDKVISKIYIPDKSGHFTENKRTALNVVDGKTPSTSNAIVKVLPKDEVIINITEISYRSGQLKINKKAAVVKVGNEHTDPETKVTLKVAKIEDAINRTEILDRNAQLKENMQLALLKEDNTLSNSKVNAMVASEEGEAINRTEILDRNAQLKENMQLALLKEDNTLSNSKVNAMVASEEGEAINRTEILDRNAQLKENMQLALLKEDNTLSNSKVNAMVASEEGEAINRTEISDRNAQLKENMQIPLLKEEATYPTSNVIAKAAPKVEEVNNRTEISDRNAQLKENMQIPLLKEVATYPTSNVIAKASPKVEEVNNRTEISDRNAQLKENMQLALLKEDTLSKSNLNVKLASNDLAIDRSEISDRSPLMEKQAAIFKVEYDANRHSKTNIDSQVVPKVEGTINRTVFLVKNVQLNGNKNGGVFKVKNENTISESKVSAGVASNAGNAFNRIMGSTINNNLTKKNDVSSTSELNKSFNESENRGKYIHLTDRKHTFSHVGDRNSLLESSIRSKMGTKRNETVALKKTALDKPISYSPLSPSPSRRSTKLAALQFIKNTPSSLKKKEVNNKKESTQCNDNFDQSNKLEVLNNCPKQDKEKDNLNQSLLHTHHVKQITFKCPKTDNVGEKGSSFMITKLQNTIGAIAKLISSKVDSKVDQMESSTATQERNKPTVCPSNTVMKMLQEKALTHKKKQVSQRAKIPKFCSLSYADILIAEVNRKNQTKKSS